MVYETEKNALLHFLHGCRKRRLGRALTPETECDQTATDLPPMSVLIATSFWKNVEGISKILLLHFRG
jgi:hypothetical protein